MNLGEIIKQYRQEHDLSQRQFASRCSVSNGYISMIEDGKNPRTKEPILPSISMLKKVAFGMGMSLDDLLLVVDEFPVMIPKTKNSPSEEALTEGEKMLLDLFRRVPEDKQEIVLQMIRAALGSQVQ